MKDILRLSTYLKPYKGRILLAVIAAFLSSACLAAFLVLVRPIIKQTFQPADRGGAGAAVSREGSLASDAGGRDEPGAGGRAGAGQSAAGRAFDGTGPAGQPAAAGAPGRPGGAGQSVAGGTLAGPAGQSAAAGAHGGETGEGLPEGEKGPRGATLASAEGLDRLQAWARDLQAGIERRLGIAAIRAYIDASPYTRAPLFIVLIFLLKGIFTYFAEYWLKWVGYRTIQDLRLDLFEKVLGQSARFFSRHPTGMLMSRVMGDVGRLQKIASTNLADAVRLTFTVLITIVWVFYVSWRLSLLCLVAMPLVLVPLVRFGRRLKSASRQSQEKAADVSNILNETIAGNRIVKAFGMEAFEQERFRSGLARMFRTDMRTLRTIALTSPFLEFTGAVLGAAVFWYAGLNINRGVLDGPGFFVFLLALGYLFVSLKSLSSMNNDLQQAMAAAARVFEMMDMENEIVEAAEAVDLPAFAREVRFENVSFRYDHRVVLDGIDLVARAGEVHALVGSSGAGKTTLVNLIPRFYDVTGGAVTIDGLDVRRARLASIRRQIAVVTQETILFNDSARNNIAYGNPSIAMERVIAAAKAAGAHAFIEVLPEGYDTVIGEQGTRLSAGQRQRITIARAFLKNAPVLILDEATSALDAESEAIVQRALEVLMQGRTSIVIAHRLSTIRRADCIHVLEHGRIVERGRHDELVARGGPYERLYAIQFREVET